MTQFDPETFMQKIAAEMKAKNIADKAELVRRAKHAGHQLSESVLSNIAHGRGNAGGKVCLAIAAGLGISPDVVLGWAGHHNIKPKDTDLNDFERRVIDKIRGNLDTEAKQRGFIEFVENYISLTESFRKDKRTGTK